MEEVTSVQLLDALEGRFTDDGPGFVNVQRAFEEKGETELVIRANKAGLRKLGLSLLRAAEQFDQVPESDIFFIDCKNLFTSEGFYFYEIHHYTEPGIPAPMIPEARSANDILLTTGCIATVIFLLIALLTGLGVILRAIF